MCDTCDALAGKVEKAKAEGNDEKKRVMEMMLENHLKQHKQHNIVVVAPDFIVFPGGQRWEVVR